MLTLKDLLITRFISLLDDINPTLTTSQREALHPGIRKTIIEFIIFMEEYARVSVQQDQKASISMNFLKEINRIIINIIDDAVNEDHNLLSMKNINPSKFKEVCHIFSDVMNRFYVHDVFQEVEDDCNALGLATFDVGVFVNELAIAIADNMFPLEDVKIYGIYADEILNAADSITRRIVSSILFIPYAQIYKQIGDAAVAAELHSLKDPVILNALWIIKKIDEDIRKDISGCNLELLGKQAKALDAKGFTSFSHVAHYASLRKKEHISEDPIVLQSQRKFDSVAGDVNDLLMLSVVTCSKQCISVPCNKQDIMRAIIPSLLLHSLLYLCISVEDDVPFKIKDFAREFSHKNLSTQQCLPGVRSERLSLADANMQLKIQHQAAQIAISYMMQFILRITDHKVSYASSPGFEAECRAACMGLLSPSFNGTPRSVHASPDLLPMFSGVMKNVLGNPPQSNEPPRKMLKLAPYGSKYNLG